MNQIEDASLHFQTRCDFLKLVSENLKLDSKAQRLVDLREAIKADGVDPDFEGLFPTLTPDEIYNKLNCGGAKTRDWMILDANGFN